MTTAEKAQNKPAEPAPRDEKKEQMDAVVAYSGGKMYEIPADVAQKYESGDDHDQAEEDEVGGRDRRLLQSGYWGFHSDWAFGPYVWITDGRSYRGWHWHPNVNSPLAYDMDNY